MGRLMKRIEISDNLRNDSIWNLDGLTMDKLIEWAQDIKSEYHLKGYTEIRLSRGDCGYKGETEFNIMGTRPETDAEYKKRVSKIQKDRERQKEIKEAKKTAEYEEYLRLKVKFEARA